jgi:two-component system sensor histidine kinase/response regulator
MHMPELDGLSATRALRAHEREQALPAIPVIALTASVQAADRLAAQQAGMDGFATKPVLRDQLFDEIARVLGLESAKSVSEPVAEVDATAVVDWEHGLTLWVSRERLQTAIAGFLQAQAGAGRELEDALACQDTSTLAALAHRIGGAAGNLALPQLRLAAQALERAARTRQTVAMAAAVPALRTQLEALSALVPAPAMPAAADGPGLAGRKGADPHGLRAELDALRTALQRSELNEEALHRLTELMPGAQAAPLIAAIDAFEFDVALHCVDQLISGLPAPT